MRRLLEEDENWPHLESNHTDEQWHYLEQFQQRLPYILRTMFFIRRAPPLQDAEGMEANQLRSTPPPAASRLEVLPSRTWHSAYGALPPTYSIEGSPIFSLLFPTIFWTGPYKHSCMQGFSPSTKHEARTSYHCQVRRFFSSPRVALLRLGSGSSRSGPRLVDEEEGRERRGEEGKCEAQKEVAKLAPTKEEVVATRFRAMICRGLCVLKICAKRYGVEM
jgi:hypothetical protein